MKRVKLDKIDRRILSDLQEDGRITNVDLAQNAGISAPPCLRRVRALEEAGYLRGYHADVTPSLMGYSVMIFAQVGLAAQTDEKIREFLTKIDEWDCVRECHLLAGDTDFLLRVVAQNWDDYQHFLTTQLMAAPNVNSVKSSLCIKTAKNKAGIPIDID